MSDFGRDMCEAPRRGLALRATGAAIVLWLVVAGAWVLSMRQARLEAASELARSTLRIREHEHSLVDLRAKLGELARVESLMRRAAEVGLSSPLQAVSLEEIDRSEP